MAHPAPIITIINMKASMAWCMRLPIIQEPFPSGVAANLLITPFLLNSEKLAVTPIIPFVMMKAAM